MHFAALTDSNPAKRPQLKAKTILKETNLSSKKTLDCATQF